MQSFPSAIIFWTALAYLYSASSLISQTSFQTTDHACSPFAEVTRVVNSWMGLENVNNILQHYEKPCFWYPIFCYAASQSNAEKRSLSCHILKKYPITVENVGNGELLNLCRTDTRIVEFGCKHDKCAQSLWDRMLLRGALCFPTF